MFWFLQVEGVLCVYRFCKKQRYKKLYIDYIQVQVIQFVFFVILRVVVNI